MIRKEFDELKDSGQLPSPSGVGLKILCLTQDDDWSIDDLVSIIQADPALTGRVIRLANSALNGGNESITTVRGAAARVGLRSVASLALGFSLVAGNREGRCESFDYDAFWSDCLARAVAAEALARQSRRSVPTETFTCALLQRIGELALASVHPTSYSELLRIAQCGLNVDLRALETERFAIDSREVSTAMMADWGLPEWFVDAVAYHDVPEGETYTKDTKARELMSVLRLAHVLARFCVGDQEGQVGMWPEMESVRSELGMDADGFSSFCAAVGRSWAEWGEVFRVQTNVLPSVEHVERMSVRVRTRQEQKSRENGDVADAFRSLRILAVDDEPVSLKLLERHLLKAGHQVLTATNGEDALSMTLEWNPHIVISDWMMPGMDGLGLCKALRRALAGRSIYFLLLTGQGEEDRVVEAFESGIDDYVVKPFNPKILLARVRAGLRLVNLRDHADQEQRKNTEARAKMGILTRKLRDMAHTDLLTGVPNRRYGMDRLHEEWNVWTRKGQPLSVVMADVDHFKRVNDQHGHDVGDVVLREVARVMRNEVRAMDVVTRIGGEEFLVVCPDTDIEGARECAERVRSAIETHRIEFGSFSGGVTMSVGVASVRPGIQDVDELMRRADAAVYAAKDAGRNRVEYDEPDLSLPRSA